MTEGDISCLFQILALWLIPSLRKNEMLCVSECDSADVSPQYCLGTTRVWLAWSFAKHVSRQSSVWCIIPVEISPKNLRKGYTCYLGQKSTSFSNVALNVKSLTWHFQQGSLENNIFAAGMRFLAEILPCLCYEPCVWGASKKYLPEELEERIWLIWFDQIHLINLIKSSLGFDWSKRGFGRSNQLKQ